MPNPKITVAGIDEQLAKFTKNITEARLLGHVIAMMIVRHAAPVEAGAEGECNGTGDCDRALKLAEAMPKSWKVQLDQWFHAFTPIRVNLSAGNVGFDKRYTKLEREEKLTWWKVAEADANPFHSFKKELEPKPFDFKAMRSMIERLPETIRNKINEGLVPAEDIPTAYALIAKLDSMAVVRVKAKEAANEPEPVVEAPAEDAPVEPMKDAA